MTPQLLWWRRPCKEATKPSSKPLNAKECVKDGDMKRVLDRQRFLDVYCL